MIKSAISVTWDFSSGAGQWLSAYGASELGLAPPASSPAPPAAPAIPITSGIQVDDDWFKISVPGGLENVTIDARFLHAAGIRNYADIWKRQLSAENASLIQEFFARANAGELQLR